MTAAQPDDEGVPDSKLANWHPTRDPWSWKGGGLVELNRLVGIDGCSGNVGLCSCTSCGQSRVGEHWLAIREVGQ